MKSKIINRVRARDARRIDLALEALYGITGKGDDHLRLIKKCIVGGFAKPRKRWYQFWK